MGTNVMVAAVGLVIGPVLGGALVELSWHWVFWFNVPLGLLGTAWAAVILRELVVPEVEDHFDWWGTVTFVGRASPGLTLGISRGGLVGWNDPLTIGSLIVAAVLLPRSSWSSAASRCADARPRTCSRTAASRPRRAPRSSAGLSRFSLTFVFVLYFQGALGDDPIVAGVKLAPLALGVLDQLAARRALRRPPRRARAGGARARRLRGRHRRDDDDRHDDALRGHRRPGCSSPGWAGHVQLARTPPR